MRHGTIALLIGLVLTGAGLAMIGAGLYLGLFLLPEFCQLTPLCARLPLNSYISNVFGEYLRILGLVRLEFGVGLIIIFIGMATVITFGSELKEGSTERNTRL